MQRLHATVMINVAYAVALKANPGGMGFSLALPIERTIRPTPPFPRIGPCRDRNLRGVVKASGTKVNDDAVKQEDGDKDFTDFLVTLVKMEGVLERDQGGFAVQVCKLKPEDRDWLQEQMDSVTDRLQKLRKESDANPTRT
jgi:hypothetical protein